MPRRKQREREPNWVNKSGGFPLLSDNEREKWRRKSKLEEEKKETVQKTE